VIEVPDFIDVPCISLCNVADPKPELEQPKLCHFDPAKTRTVFFLKVPVPVTK
jgi:hypothetical protein